MDFDVHHDRLTESEDECLVGSLKVFGHPETYYQVSEAKADEEITPASDDNENAAAATFDDDNDDDDDDDDDDEDDDDDGYDDDDDDDYTKRGKRGRPKGTNKEANEPDMKVKRPKRILSLEMLTAAFCCSLLCLTITNSEQHNAARENYQAMDSGRQRQWLLDYFWSHSKYNLEKDCMEYIFIIGTQAVCAAAFRLVLGIASSTFYEIRNRFKNGEKIVDRCSRLGRRSIGSMAALTWLQDHAKKYAEKMPDANVFHFPPCQTRTSIYHEMKQDLSAEDEEVLSFSHFLKLWREEMRHICIPKASRLSKCDKCTKLKLDMAKAVTEAERKAVREDRHKHLQKQNNERLKYYKHQKKAKDDPNRYLSIIIDAMDQAKTALPHFLYPSKFTSSMWKLKVHLVGVVVHGIGVYGFFDLFEWKHSTNLTLTILMDIFAMMEDSLPDILYLQMDNCWKENKNQYVLAFFALLVEKKIFKKVKLSFLMVGHTHEDVDQVFSRFSCWLKRHSALSLDNMMEAFEKSYTPSPTSVRTTKVFDIKSWLETFADSLSYQSKPHCFKITLGQDGHAKLVTKKWATDKVWMDTEGNPHMLMHLPTDEPNTIPPDYSAVLVDKLKMDVKNSFDFFDDGQAKDWWIKVIDGSSEDILQDTNDTWTLPALQDAKEQRDQIEDTLSLQASQLELEDDDDDIPAVFIGKRKRKPKEGHVDQQEGENELKSGDLCLLNIAKYNNEWPQLAKVLSISMDEGQAEVEWFKGCKSGPWKPCTIRKGPRFVPFIELVPLSAIWLSGFELTPGNSLPSRIKKAVENYKAENML